MTTRPGEERDLAEAALRDGFELIVAVGGDGTWSNVADRVVASGRDDVAFGVLPSGTGNDFGRNLGFDPAGGAEAVRVLAEGHVRRVDVGRLDTPSASEHTPGSHEPRHFLNLIGFGFDIAVLDAAAGARFLRGELLYKLTALQQLFRFPGFEVGLSADDAGRRDGRHLMLTISNGRFFGGGFPIAPRARIDDGKLHACRIMDAPPLTRLRLFNLAEKGRARAVGSGRDPRPGRVPPPVPRAPTLRDGRRSASGRRIGAGGTHPPRRAPRGGAPYMRAKTLHTPRPAAKYRVDLSFVLQST